MKLPTVGRVRLRPRWWLVLATIEEEDVVVELVGVLVAAVVLEEAAAELRATETAAAGVTPEDTA